MDTVCRGGFLALVKEDERARAVEIGREWVDRLADSRVIPDKWSDFLDYKRVEV